MAKLHALALEKQETLDNITASSRRLHSATSEIRHRYQEQLFILEELRSELKTSEEAVGSLDKVASMLRKDLDVIKGLLHPIRRAPDDILRQIFEETMQVGSKSYHEKQQWMAIWLSHVCRRWRGVAVSMPRIWSHMSFTIKPNGLINKTALKTYIRRAKNAPIFLKLKFNFPDYATAVNQLAIHTLQFSGFLFLPRLSMLEIEIDAQCDASFLNHFPQFPVIAIDTLTLSVSSKDEEEISMASLVSKFPPVHKLRIQEASFGSFDAPLEEMFAFRLVELELLYVNDIPLQLLTQLPNLRRCLACGSDIAEFPTDDLSDGILPRLETLEVSLTVFPWARVQCPRLTTLIISIFEAGEQELENWGSFIERTQSLSSLSIEQGSSARFYQLARRASQIRRLRITDDEDGAVIRDAFLDESILPDLQRLTFFVSWDRLPIAGLNAAIRIRRMRKILLQETEDGPDFGHLQEIVVEINSQDVHSFDERNKGYLKNFFDLYEEGTDPSVWSYLVISDGTIE
ncbi:hypothetical protein M408DRAFT_29198 [Serendipita vermifera MAFF 305830]|uniref:Uncharacterized protein n=1 Tax=Serendipita vermifera MAFF 305830 TaxID=933852 RepID=A0A0C3AP80_SERVB|nr:hypothetical protein M408DRAFT_29198 [Serendipita vermifera MAFF 305830]